MSRVHIVILSLVLIQILAIILDRFFFESASYVLSGSDFVHYLAAARLVRDGMGHLIYNVEANFEAQRQVLGPNMPISILTFRSLPFVALLFVPFTYLSALTSYRLFGFVNIFLIILVVSLFTRYFSKKRIPAFFLLALSFTFIPILETLKNGQVSILLTTLLFGIFLSFKKKKYLLGGFLTSLLLIKTQFIIFFPYLFILSINRRKFLMGFAGGLLGIILLSSMVSGVNFWLLYPKHLLKTEGPEFGSRMTGLFTLYALFQNLGVWRIIAVFLSGILYLLTLILFKNKHKEIGFQSSFISFILLAIPLAVHVLLHDLSFLLLPIFIISSSLYQDLVKRKILVKNLFFLALLFVLPIMAIKVSPNFLSLVIFGLGLYFLYSKLPKIE